jgi:hypothetical protein
VGLAVRKTPVLIKFKFSSPPDVISTIRVAVCLLTPLVIGCSSEPNHRYYYKNNVKLTAILADGKAIYQNLLIGNPDRPFDLNPDQLPDIVVELAEGNAVPVSRLSVSQLEKTSSQVKHLDDVGYDTGWPNGSRRLTIGTRLFAIVHGDRILQLYANTVGLRGKERPPRFGSKDGDTLYAMPFGHAQVVELFGEPDKMHDMWHK